MTGKVRILHLRASPFVGGPERQIMRYASFDYGPNLEHIIGSFVDDVEGKDFLLAAQAQGVRTIAFPGQSTSAFRELKAFIRDEKISLLCTHGYKADVLGILAARIQAIPVAAFMRGWTAQDWKVRIYENLDRLLLPFADAVVALSRSQQQRLSVSARKRHLVTNVIDLAPITSEKVAEAKRQLRESFHLPNDSRIVGSAGRLSPEKGTAYFVKAAKELEKRFPDVRYIIFGGGAERSKLEQLVAGDKNIILAGHTPDFKELLPGVDVLVNPSLMEEMPNVVLEAMASEVPVVATNVGGVPDIAGPGPTIALVPAADPAAIAHAVSNFPESPSEAAKMATAARARLASEYSPELQRRELAGLYQKLIPVFGQAVSRQTPADPPTELPTITIAMPVRNEERYIKSVLDALLTQDYPKDKYEILIADGESTDQTREIVNQVAAAASVPVKLISNPKRLSSAGRNVGVTNGRGEIVAFVDGHCIIENDRWLRNIADIFATTGAMCLCRPQPLDDPSNTAFQDMIAKCRGSNLGHGLDSSIFDLNSEKFINPTSSGAIYKREVFDKVGLYDESFDACEDVELNHRIWKAGLPAYISPGVTVRYAPRKELRGLFRQMSRYGQGRFHFISKHPDAVSLGQLIPPAFVATLLLALVLAPFVPLALYALLLMLALYLVAVVTSSVVLALRHGARFLWGGPAIYPTIHFGLGIGFWKGFFRGKRHE